MKHNKHQIHTLNPNLAARHLRCHMAPPISFGPHLSRGSSSLHWAAWARGAPPPAARLATVAVRQGAEPARPPPLLHLSRPLPFQTLLHCRRPGAPPPPDSPVPVSHSSIPHAGTFPSLFSTDSGAHPAPSLAVQGSRRRCPPAATPPRWAASPTPLLAVRAGVSFADLGDTPCAR